MILGLMSRNRRKYFSLYTLCTPVHKPHIIHANQPSTLGPTEIGGTELTNAATTAPDSKRIRRTARLRSFVIDGIVGGTRSTAVNGTEPRRTGALNRPGTGERFAGGLLLTSVLLLSACAHAPTDPEARAEYQQTNDPAEPTNRTIFVGNQFVDHHALQPVARGYENYVPGRVRKSLHNFVGNLGQPAVAVNDLFQGNFGRAWNTTQRFAINTTVGGVGLFDVATDWNRPEHSADFGQTLGVWGVGPGPAVQLPLFGPSDVRDSVGKVVDLVTNPTSLVGGGAAATVAMASGGVGIVDKRAELLPATDALEHNSLDYYAVLRSAAAQRRAALVTQGKAGLVTDHKGEATPPQRVSQASPAAAAE
jgi:phospholipid-binding lipoprotein MlaA